MLKWTKIIIGSVKDQVRDVGHDPNLSILVAKESRFSIRAHVLKTLKSKVQSLAASAKG